MTFLLTGDSGFLGRYVFNELSAHQSTIYSIGRDERNTLRHYLYCDLAKKVPVLPGIFFDKVVHIAGTAHIFPKTKEDRDAQYNSNYRMTEHLVQALDQIEQRPAQILFISSVAVYGLETGIKVSETAETKPVSPYGKAKLDSEKLLVRWCAEKGVSLVILRLPLIAGENPPGNLGDMKKAIANGKYVRLRGNNAKKSIVLAPDVANLIVSMGNEKNGIYHLTDGEDPSFSAIEKAIETRVGKKIKITVPHVIIRFISKIGDLFEWTLKRDMPINSARLKKLMNELTFDDSKARKELEWKPNPAIEFIQNKI